MDDIRVTWCTADEFIPRPVEFEARLYIHCLKFTDFWSSLEPILVSAPQGDNGVSERTDDRS